MRSRITLLGGFAEPFGRLTKFLRHTCPGLIAITEITLRRRIILIRGSAKPFDGLGIVLLDALSGLIADGEITLRGSVALVAEASEIARQAGHGVLPVIAVIVLFGLLVGHVLGGPDAGNRGALALATSARHPGLAIALSATNFPHDREAIIAAVLLFLLANLVLTLPYALWRRRRALGSKARNTAL